MPRLAAIAGLRSCLPVVLISWIYETARTRLPFVSLSPPGPLSPRFARWGEGETKGKESIGENSASQAQNQSVLRRRDDRVGKFGFPHYPSPQVEGREGRGDRRRRADRRAQSDGIRRFVVGKSDRVVSGSNRRAFAASTCRDTLRPTVSWPMYRSTRLTKKWSPARA